jgi:hypothetical protein
MKFGLRHLPLKTFNGEDLNLERLTSILTQVSISPTFYKRLFCTKVFCAAFLYLQFGFEVFCQNNIGTKTAHKMLVKLATGSHFLL